mgnify:CR=1 FL=1
MVNIVREKLNDGWIRCNIVLEVLGRPAEYLNEIIRKVVDDLEKEKNIAVVEKKFHDPSPCENMFTTFAELDLMMRDMQVLLEFIMLYMPSHIEIIEPSEIKMNLHSANDFANKIVAKMHQYDAIAKRFKFENSLMKNKLKELGQLPKEIEDVDKIIEAQKQQLQQAHEASKEEETEEIKEEKS